MITIWSYSVCLSLGAGLPLPRADFQDALVQWTVAERPNKVFWFMQNGTRAVGRRCRLNTSGLTLGVESAWVVKQLKVHPFFKVVVFQMWSTCTRTARCSTRCAR